MPIGRRKWEEMNLYREQLMDHYRNPRNQGRIENPSFTSGEYNPSCGDSIVFDGIIENGILSEVAFVGKGCVISQAAASLLGQHCKNKSINDILAMEKKSVLALVGMQLGPTRLQCALLPLMALQNGIKTYLKEKNA